jgi:autotransporter-associated beta strand protein
MNTQTIKPELLRKNPVRLFTKKSFAFATATALALVLAATTAQAASVLKAGMGTDLNAPASWGGAATPTVTDVATWDSTSLGAGLTLAAATNWQGISVSGALTDIAVTGAGALTLGASGVDLSASTANMSFANLFVLSSGQTWNIGAGRTFTAGRVNSSVGGLTKSGDGIMALGAGGLSFLTGDLDVTGGTVRIGINDLLVGGLTGTGIVENGSATTRWLFVTNTADKTFAGVLQNGAGAGRLGLAKRNPGTLTLTKTNTYTDNTTIENGTIVIPANAQITGGFNNSDSGMMNIGTVNGQNGSLIIDGGTVIANARVGGAVFNSSMRLGTAAGARGFVKLNSGILTTTRQLAVGGGANNANQGYGAYSQIGGTATIGGFLAMGLGGAAGADRSVFNQSGGTFTSTSGPATIGAGALGIGVMNLSGTAVYSHNSPGTDNGMWFGESGAGTLNLSGSATLTVANNAVQLGRGNVATALGIANLNGGTLTTLSVTKPGAAASGNLNFNGGTLKANANNTGFVTGLSGVYLYPNGATIDSAGFDVTVASQLSAPTGEGVSAIAVAAGGSGYLDTPVVIITGGSGSGACAVATVSGGAVTGVTVTSPGRDYNNADVLTITLFGGGGTGATAGAVTFTPNTSGGLTKNGAGTLTLAGGSSYTGPTVVTGGGLSVLPSTVSYSPTTVTLSNASLSINASGGFSSYSPTSLTLQNNSTLNLDYGSVTANPTAAALNVSGGLTAPGSSLVINIAGFGLKPGTFTLIDYTGAALANLANFTLGPLPPGVVATLVNNTANTSIDLNITSSGQNLTWVGTNANTGLIDNTWDIAITTNWVETGGSAALRYQEYTTTSTVGDPVRFDDFLFNDFINPQPTNINLTTALQPFTVTVDSTLPYSFDGVGSLTGSGSLIKSNTGSLTLTTSNSYTGGTLIYGGSVVITNDNALGAAASKVTLGGGSLQVNASTTNASRAVSVTAASTISIATNTTLQLGGVINGAGGLTKSDLGLLIVAGSNGITGNLTVEQGTLRNTGTQILPAVARVGNTAGLNGVLHVSGGTFQAANNGGQFASSLIVGATAGSAGDVILSGGTLSVMQQLGLGAGQGGYGALTMSSGTLNCGSYLVVGFNNDRAVYNQTGGTVTISSNIMTIAAGGTGSMGVANISGGTFNSTFSSSGGIQVGERGIGTLNVSGSAVINTPTNLGITVGPGGAQNGWDGTVNLNGGTVTVNRLVKGAGTGVAKINFNGGTVKASTANTTFLSGLDSANVYSGGLTLDDGGFAITVPQALQQPTDYGVSSITISGGNGGAGYIDSPIVMISGGSGSNATAIATVSGGAVTAVTVTCPGSGYASGDVLSVSFDNGGAAVTAATANTPTLALNVSGGLIKKGAGTVNLTGANTYSGSNYVSAGTLLLSPAHQVTGQAVGVASNAAFGVLVNATGAATVGNVTFGSTTLDKHAMTFVLSTGSNSTSPVLQCGTLTLNGTNTVRLSGLVSAGTFPLVQYTGALAGSGAFNSTVAMAQGLVGTLSNYVAGSTLYVTVTGTPGIFWTGTNTVAAQTNVWNLNTITNWLAAGIPTTYQETTPPGDPTTFNDIGSGVVLLSNTASPASVTINNATKNYAFSGPGKISGPTGVTKTGPGTATMSLAGNDYSGSTTVSAGRLALGSGTAIPDGATASGVSIASSGTLDMAGFSETINGLSGSGLIDNSSGTASTLTVGNGNGGGTWSGTISNTAGTVTLIKTGTGSLTISGTNYPGGTSQFNGGTNYLTNTGRILSVGTGEFWVQQNAGTSRFIMNGGSLSVNNWFVVGRNAAAANGSFILNSGTVTKTGGGNVVIGSLNATGLLEINGGQFLNNSMLWLGENASANATLQLNGGLVQATQIRPNGATPASSVAYFNGGILQASAGSDDFFGTNATSARTTLNISSGGLVFDTQAFGVTNQSDLLEDGASPGLVKLGSGVLAITSGGNSYSGLTTVSNGTLLIDGTIPAAATVKSGATLGGIGTIGGLVTVEAGGRLAAGDSIGALTLNVSPVLNGSVVAELDRNSGTPLADLITVSGLPIAYGGTLVLTNTGAELEVGDTFALFNASSYSGSFTLVSQTPNQIVTWNTSQLTVNGTISVATVTPAVNTTPVPINHSVTGNTLNLSWPPDHLGWTLQTNSVSVANSATWYPLAGSATVTNVSLTIDPSQTNVFFRLVYP